MAEKMQEVGDRWKLFCHMHIFLSPWEPTCLTLEDRRYAEGKADLKVQSELADCVPKFPDHLLGGTGSEASLRVQEMFGYPKRVVSQMLIIENTAAA